MISKNQMLILVYILSVTLANLSAATFGIWATPFNAFLLIGLEITSRDVLHSRITKPQMFGVITVAGVLSFLININTTMIAVASLISVSVACLLDYYVFGKVKGGWWKKSNTSNVFSSLADSVLFPTIAFGVLSIPVILAQFTLKVIGGLFWSTLFVRLKSLKRSRGEVT